MATLAELQSRRDLIAAAIDRFYASGGVQNYTEDGVAITLANVEQMERSLSKLDERIARMQAAGRPGGGRILYHRRGSC